VLIDLAVAIAWWTMIAAGVIVAALVCAAVAYEVLGR
jgi:hypothetical protein